LIVVIVFAILYRENQKNYVLEVVFTDSLVTIYGKTLEFSQKITGNAEIITEDDWVVG